MPITRPPARFLLNGACHDGCSVGPVRIGEAQYRRLHADIEAGWADLSVAERANERGLSITHGSVNRHRKRHLLSAEMDVERADYADLSDLEALDMAIRQGQKNISAWKMTPSEWMKAIELRLRLTEGTVYDSFLAAVASASQEVSVDDATGDDVRPGDVVGPADAA